MCIGCFVTCVLMLSKVRREHQIPWNWNYRCWEASGRCWESSPKSAGGAAMNEPSLQPQVICLYRIKHAGVGEMTQSVVKNTDYSAKGPELNSQHPHGSSLIVTPWSNTLYRYAYRQNTNVHKIIIIIITIDSSVFLRMNQLLSFCVLADSTGVYNFLWLYALRSKNIKTISFLEFCHAAST